MRTTLDIDDRGGTGMKLPRRRFLYLAAAAVALAALPRTANAEAYPLRPVRIIVGFAPGGGTDIMARLIGSGLSSRLGQQVVVENRPGAGTNIATDGGRACARRRLYAAARLPAQCDQRDALRQSQVQLPPRHRADCRHCARRLSRRGESRGA